MRKKYIAGFDLSTPDALTTALWKIKKWEVYIPFLWTADIYDKFEHGQNCVKAIRTPCLSANIVNTQGFPIGVKA